MSRDTLGSWFHYTADAGRHHTHTYSDDLELWNARYLQTQACADTTIVYRRRWSHATRLDKPKPCASSSQPDLSTAFNLPEYHLQIAMRWIKEQVDWPLPKRRDYLGNSLFSYREFRVRVGNIHGHTRALRLQLRPALLVTDDQKFRV
jgi:hypothetical protein